MGVDRYVRRGGGEHRSYNSLDLIQETVSRKV